jgi:pantoate--beta-alanine ligase
VAKVSHFERKSYVYNSFTLQKAANMILFKKSTDLHAYLEKQREMGKKVGFAPTMGALHEGHISLVNASKKSNDLTVSSIFVNPTQFNDASDFEKYPVTIDTDIFQLETAGCDVLFLPAIPEIYPPSHKKQHYDLGYLETVLEGKYRPGHFQGVCMVVHRLLEIVRPDNLYLGQKDYQQCMVIKRLITLIGMNDQTRVNISPTLRELDGLAMSSRNMRLNPTEREKAPAIYQSLLYLEDNLKPGALNNLIDEATKQLSEKGFKVDYIAIADANTLELVEKWDGQRALVSLVAAYNNEIRLIDNLLIS